MHEDQMKEEKPESPIMGSNGEEIDEEHDFLDEPPGDPSLGYETQEFLKPRRVISFVLFLVFMAASAIIGMIYLERWWAGPAGPEADPSPFADTRSRLSNAPLLQADPQVDMDVLREVEAKRVNSYGWIDREAGVVHIPVDRAMDLILQEGLPYRDEGAPITRPEPSEPVVPTQEDES
jgi:hypothetical protein